MTWVSLIIIVVWVDNTVFFFKSDNISRSYHYIVNNVEFIEISNQKNSSQEAICSYLSCGVHNLYRFMSVLLLFFYCVNRIYDHLNIAFNLRSYYANGKIDIERSGWQRTTLTYSKWLWFKYNGTMCLNFII